MRESGSASVEFALVLPLLLLVLLASVEVVVVARTQLQLGHAAREGAREAATTPDLERAIAAVQRSLDDGAASRVRVSIDRQQHVGGTARVTATLRHSIAASLFGGFTVTLSSSAVMRVER
ncbi:MAG: pilus assembly protein [Acidobacteria bacterium]|nr:pilus assembly protein [Acidobacteriota bacterium]